MALKATINMETSSHGRTQEAGTQVTLQLQPKYHRGSPLKLALAIEIAKVNC